MTRLLTLALVPALFGCKEPAEEVRQVGSYESVDNESAARMHFDDESQPGSIRIQCDAIATAKLKTEIDESGTLKLKGVGAEDCTVYLSTAGVTSVVVRGNGHFRSDGNWVGLTRVEIRGNGDMDLESVAATRFSLMASGNGNLTVETLTASELELELSGNGDVSLAGDAETATVTMSGNGNLRARRLIIRDLDIFASGSGTAEVTATNSVHASLSGAGRIDLWGGAEATVTGDSSLLFLHEGE